MTQRRPFISSLSLVLVAGSAALAGPTFEEVPDAGSSPSTAQPVTGSGSTARIKGELTATADANDFEDMFLICISDPSAFSATIDPVATNFNTQLWLFKLDGYGLLGNDNDAGSFPTIYSKLLPNATDGSGSTIPGPGLYLLAISSKTNVPVSQAGAIFHDPTVAGIEITGPDGPGGNFPVQQWSHSEGTVGGKYAIDLTGVKPFEVPCGIACPQGAAIDDDALDCDPNDFDVNGGCTEPGAPLQNIGAVAPGAYRAVCGTTGVEFDRNGPEHKDRDWFRFAVTAPGYLYGSLVTKTLGGGPATNARVTLYQGTDCSTSVELMSKTDPACPLEFGPIPVADDNYVVVVTLDGNLPPGPQCPVQYVLWLYERPTKFEACGHPGTAACFVRHPTPGCNKPLCCDAVCIVDPTCCEEAWDGSCVALATNICIGDPCPADLNGDDVVGGADLAVLLGQWGGGPSSQADLNGDGIVNAADLAIVLGAWGPCD
ncbi:MAG: hypothetical protein JNL80_05040 [Phycisphaerae bacterium]|jgi:hypothetical protein|nr:hypothetical protein [Phycisphaerae bacterium]